ncbi:MAG: alpha/beta fold hydrolase [Candidatus Eisenbacteria bacterium]
MRRLLFVAAALIASCTPALAQTRGAFVMTMGKDTVAVERFERDTGRLSGVTLFQMMNVRTDWSLELDADGSARRMKLEARYANAPLGAKPLQEGTLEFWPDSVIGVLAGARRAFPAKPGLLPYLNPSMVLFEQALRRSRTGGEAGEVDLFFVTGGNVATVPVTHTAPDTFVLGLGGTDVKLAVNPAGEVVGGAIPSQQIVFRRVEAMSLGSLVLAKPDYSAPPGAHYVAEEVRVPSTEGFELAGTLTRPRQATGRVPAVVTITGSGSEDRDEALTIVRGYRPFREVAEALAARGIATLRLDDRGFGESGGSASNATSFDFSYDVEAALKFLRARPDIDGARLALVGHSEGGLIAPIVAARDSTLRGIVLLAGPAYTGRRILDYQQRTAFARMGYKGARLDSASAAAAAATDSIARKSRWMSFFLDHDPLGIAKSVRTPVLVLQGATDRQVTAEQAKVLAGAFRAGGNRDVTLRVFPATNHLFLADPAGWGDGYSALPDPHVRREVLDAMGEWLAAKLAAKP